MKNTKVWSAKGDVSNSTVIISKEGVEVACIMQEQVIHGLEYCEGTVLKEEIVLAYQDILQDLGIEGVVVYG